MDDYLKMDDYLNKFLWRAGYEFLQIEGLEIGYVSVSPSDRHPCAKRASPRAEGTTLT